MTREERNRQLNALLSELRGILPKYGNATVNLTIERDTRDRDGNMVHVKESATLDLDERPAYEPGPIPDETEVFGESVTVLLSPFPEYRTEE